MKRWVYDIEVYPNLFLLCAKIPNTDTRVTFAVCSFRDDRQAMLEWLQHQVEEMVGFNSIYYDYPVLHYIILKLLKLRGRDFCKKIYLYSKSIIKGKKKYIREKDYVRKQIDLFKINHYDNKAKSTSLKLLEFNLKLKNIRELPFPPGKVLTDEEIQVVIDYCDNDVDATELVYNETLSEIELREKLSPQYDIDFTNYNSTKIGEYILISKIIDVLGEQAVYNLIETDYGIRKKIKNTKRESINLNDVIFNYVDFTTEPFQKILQWFKSKIITETKGVFSKIPLEQLSIIEGYYATEKLKWDESKQRMVWKKLINTKNELETLNVVYKDFQYDFGVGGIHGSIKSGVYEADENYDIWDWDVASYYPNLAIKQKFYPQHFGEEFCNIYESIYLERKKYNKKTHPAENLALKLALNGSYGKSNSEYSALYDPQYTMQTTVNGQLLLCMLSERFMEEIPDCTMLQINTDGMTIKIHKDYVEQMKSICKRWEDLTQLELESIKYSKMIIKDVNNYIAVAESGYVKRKGAAFIYKVAPGELELHKNFSMLIIPKALEAYFVEGTDPEQFIMSHNDIYDFFKRTKINKTDKLYLRDINNKGNIIGQEELQRVTRYYVSGYQEYCKEKKVFSFYGTGKVLVKEMPPLKPKITKKLQTQYSKAIEQGFNGTIEQYAESIKKLRNTNIESGYLCTVVNDMTNFSVEQMKSTINYQYYIDEVYKVINLIENTEL